MVESPLFIRPYISKMTRSELFSLMTCGMEKNALSPKTMLIMTYAMCGFANFGLAYHDLSDYDEYILARIQSRTDFRDTDKSHTIPKA